jgi:polysaccharide deacetylase family protein (PEP-CTERM system associated)
MINAMSIDLEDWFCVHNFARSIPRDRWPACELRVQKSTETILRLLESHDVRATFFVLGWIAERVPALIAEIADRGHEIASHGYSHRRVCDLSASEFDDDLQRSLEAIRSCTPAEVHGFRAPSFSITRSTQWALPALARQGIWYDSSVFPVAFHPDYGIGDAPLTPYRFENVLEIPMSCVEVFGSRIPCSGGGYFRLYPYSLTRHLIKRCNEEGRPAVFYTHPWEFDPGQPRVKSSRLKMFRHYHNLDKTADRFDRLLGDFEFGTIQQMLVGSAQYMHAAVPAGSESPVASAP